MKRLEIKQLKSELDYYNGYHFKITDLKTNNILISDSIDDAGQGIDRATQQIHQILKRKGFII